MFAVYAHGMAPLSRIQATATDVSSPPEKAMPTRSPTGRELRTLDMGSRVSEREGAAWHRPTRPVYGSRRRMRLVTAKATPASSSMAAPRARGTALKSAPVAGRPPHTVRLWEGSVGRGL